MNIKCRLCGSENMSLQSVHRFSGPAVTVGYIFCVLAGLGMLGALGFGLLSVAASAGTANQTVSATKPDGTPKTQQQIDLEKNAQKVGAGVCGVGGVFGAICAFLAAFVSGLLGYILVMKKKVLICAACKGHTEHST